MCMCACMHGQELYFKKVSAWTRNCILGQRSGMEGTRAGSQQQERVREVERRVEEVTVESGIGLHNGIVCYNDKREQ